jgi:UDP-N-acetylmuramoyl-L-alanyl-D-glutamate--2,6-diaminopimelate ligase
MVHRLKDILKDIDSTLIRGSTDIEITAVEPDSRKVIPGSLFFAIRGTLSDGHDFIAKAISSGASAVVCEKITEDADVSVVFIEVLDSALALGMAASAFYGHPSRNLILAGVTGTNGKTTTVTLLYQLFRRLGYKTGLISTINYLIDDRKLPSTHTTPDPVRLNQLLREMADEGCRYCFMEVSSHALAQKRTAGLHFAGGVFTNITHDHLDYHLSFSEYIKAKKLFFDHLGQDSFALINKDDRNAGFMVQNTGARVMTYALKSMADFRGSIRESHPDGMLLSIDGKEMWTGFIGGFNAYNILAAYSTGVLLGAPKEELLRAISSLGPVEGRFETIRSTNGVTAIVDYAHSPDALENVIDAIRKLPGKGNRLITVTGAGGDRDRDKRPVMANIAAHKSDTVILTSDNPRSEDPQAIINDMLRGIDGVLRDRVICITKREEAIKTACHLARPGDFILVAGKGHETYQEIKGVRHHFDDREVLRKVLGVHQDATSTRGS